MQLITIGTMIAENICIWKIICLFFIFLFSSSAVKLENLFEHYEPLNYPPTAVETSQKRFRRSLGSPETHSTIKISFFAFGENITLVLSPDENLVSPFSQLIVGGSEYPLSLSSVANHVFRGYVENHPNSSAFGSVIQGVFRGTVSFDGNFIDAFYIEPAGNYFAEETPFHSIIYRGKDVKSFPQTHRTKRSANGPIQYSFCGLSDPAIARRMMELRSPVPGAKRSKRSVTGTVESEIRKTPNIHSGAFLGSHRANLYTQRHSAPVDGANTRVCNLYLQSDTYLWDKVIRMQHIRGNRELAVKEITSIFTQHVQGAQMIYQNTLFRDHAGRLEYPGISFRVDRVLINVTEEDCKPRSIWRDFRGHSPPSPTALPRKPGMNSSTTSSSESNDSVTQGSFADENPFCAENIDVTNYLNLHSYTSHDDFCLAYVFTYRDFSGGTLGLAWVAEPNGSGGVCEKHRLMREGTHNVYKSLNTGVVTLLNYGSQVALKVSQLTFAHEMGHNFGAKHDDDHKDEPFGCLPAVDDPQGNYIMFASATSGDKDNNNKFSRCSSDSIARLLNRVMSDDTNCFLKSDGPFCGNQLTEEGEQCDCGFTASSCRDQCCHPKESSLPCKLRKSIQVNDSTLNVQCSPTAGECCTHNCQFRGSSHLCRGADECYHAAYCNGVDAKCPTSVYLPDGTPCQEHTRVCKQGQCLGSICERIPGWHECSLVRDKSVTPEMMCFVSCRENRTGSPCISTFQLEQDSKLRTQYPQLVSELLRDGKGTRLKPGAPCDNYRGYCDVFHRCRSVEAEGPLARLRDLLFSSQVLEKVKTWITRHWWAVILICLSLIIALIVFAKLCAVSTPPSRYYSSVPVRHRRSARPHPSSSVWVPPYSRPSTDAPSPWAWPRRSRQSEVNGRRRQSSNSKSKRLSLSVPPQEGVVPSAPFLDPMDFPPPNARPTPIATPSHLNKNGERNEFELIPFALMDSANPVPTTSSGHAYRGRRVSDGKSGRRGQRPTSMVVSDTGHLHINETPIARRTPGKNSKIQPKPKRQPDNRRPVSLVMLAENHVLELDSNGDAAQNPPYPRDPHVPMSCDSSVPPPAYEDL